MAGLLSSAGSAATSTLHSIWMHVNTAGRQIIERVRDATIERYERTLRGEKKPARFELLRQEVSCLSPEQQRTVHDVIVYGAV
jgi:hypothetical protein